MPMHIIEYNHNYSKTSGSSWQYYRDEPTLDNNGNIVNFSGNGSLFKSKVKITGKTPAAVNTKDIEIIAPLKYLSNFWRTLNAFN